MNSKMRIYQGDIEKEIRAILLRSPYRRATIEDSKYILAQLMMEFRDWLCDGCSIQLPYLGTLVVNRRKARIINSAFRRDGSKADGVMIPARRHVTFRDGAQLKRALHDADKGRKSDYHA